jgi:hypothetical protein
MPGSLTDVGEALTLNFATGNAATALVAPLKIALTTTAPTDAAAGTEVTGGSYARQTVTIGAASGTSPAVASNTNLISFAGMPAVAGGGVVGWDLYDSSGTPRRIWSGTFDAARTTNAGDVFEIAVGDLDLTQD